MRQLWVVGSLAGLLLVVGTPVAAEVVPLGTLRAVDSKDSAAVTVECERSADGSQMTCGFLHVKVSRVKTPEAARAELEQSLKQQPLEATTKAVCDNEKEFASQYRDLAASPRVGENQKAFMAQTMQRMRVFCAKPSPQTLREFSWFMLSKDTRTCKIRTSSWRETFIQNASRVWVSNRGPAGPCGLISVSTLEERPGDPNAKSKGPSWLFESQKILTTKTGSCGHADEEGKVRYAVAGLNPTFGCEFMEF
jgi:hypothetical protein